MLRRLLCVAALVAAGTTGLLPDDTPCCADLTAEEAASIRGGCLDYNNRPCSGITSYCSGDCSKYRFEKMGETIPDSKSADEGFDSLFSDPSTWTCGTFYECEPAPYGGCRQKQGGNETPQEQDITILNPFSECPDP